MTRIALMMLAALTLAPMPALADSQSSNSSSNCSSGRCSRVESMVIEDRWGRRGWVREERWRERGDRRHDRNWRGGYGHPHHWAPPRRGRGRDNDDD